MLKSYALQLSYDVSDEEKEEAEKALMCFDYVLRAINKATNHLDIMGVPFKDKPDIKPEELIEYRAALRRYRDAVIENFNSFKLMAFKGVNAMRPFESDTQSSKLMKSFISTIDSIEDSINDFSEAFNNLKSQTVIADINKNIDNVNKLCEELKEIIDDRIKGHIKNNILGKNWMDSVDQKLELDINENQPTMAELLKNKA